MRDGMGGLKKLAAVLAVVFAFGAMASAASASVFTSTGGPIEGMATTTQVFTFSGLSFECNIEQSTGTATALSMSELLLEERFSQCKAVIGGGKVNAEVSLAKVGLTASQTLDVLNTVTFNVPVFGCHVMIPPQGPLSTVTLSGWPVAVSSLSGITYTTTGGICGASGSSGTFTGTTHYIAPVTWDP
jgi:hypothetical protein